MKISVLGSTGSIGTQTVEIVRDHSDEFEVAAITGNRNVKLLESQARELHPRLVCAADEAAAADLKLRLADTDIKVMGGRESIIEAAALPEAEATVVYGLGKAGI